MTSRTRDEHFVRDQIPDAVVYDRILGQQRIRYLNVLIGAGHQPSRAPACLPHQPIMAAQAHPVAGREWAVILEQEAVKEVALQYPAQHQGSQNRHCQQEPRVNADDEPQNQ